MKSEQIKLTHFEKFQKMCNQLFSMDYFKELKSMEKQVMALDKDQNLIVEELMNKVIPKKAQQILRGLNLWDKYRLKTMITFEFYKSYKKVFHFNEDISKLLMMTNLNEIKAEFIQLPFDCIYLSFPEDLLFDQYGESIEGAYVLKFNTMDYKKYHFMVVAVLKSDQSNNENNFNILSFECEAKDEILAIVQGQIVKEIQDLLSFIINGILYINSSSSKNKIKEVGSTEGTPNCSKTTKLPHRVVTTNIVISSKFEEEITKENKAKSKRPQKNQIIVRGFWRQQAYGTGRKKRKLIWINPFLKNRSKPLKEKNYTVKKPR